MGGEPQLRGDGLGPFGVVWVGHDEDVASEFGAAQWNGKPSPVLQARLDHAADLYQGGAAPVVVVTGGKQEGDVVTQGVSGYQYLRDRGLPDEVIKVEVAEGDAVRSTPADSRSVGKLILAEHEPAGV